MSCGLSAPRCAAPDLTRVTHRVLVESSVAACPAVLCPRCSGASHAVGRCLRQRSASSRVRRAAAAMAAGCGPRGVRRLSVCQPVTAQVSLLCDASMSRVCAATHMLRCFGRGDGDGDAVLRCAESAAQPRASVSLRPSIPPCARWRREACSGRHVATASSAHATARQPSRWGGNIAGAWRVGGRGGCSCGAPLRKTSATGQAENGQQTDSAGNTERTRATA